MSLVRLSGEAFRRQARIFRTRRGLQDVKEVEADRLLDFHGGAVCTVLSDIPDSYIAAVPKIVHVLLLRGAQLLESPTFYPIHSPLSTAANFLRRSGLRGVIADIVGALHRTVGHGLDCSGELADVI